MVSVIPLPFINPNCISSINDLLPISVVEDPFHHFHSMFQHFNSSVRSHSIGSLSLCKLVIPHLTSSPLGCNFLSQYHYINPISTEFQYTLWHVSFLLLALTNLGLYVFSVLWHCWLGVRKSIQPVKNWVMGYLYGYLSGVWCKWFAYGPADTTATPSSLASVKSRMVYLSGR